MIDALPVVLRDEPDYQAAMHCVARSTDQKDAYIAWIRDQANPLTADGRGLGWWEALLKVRAPSMGDSIDIRRARVLARYRSLDGDPSTRDWVSRINGIVGDQPWRFEEYVPDAMLAKNLIANPSFENDIAGWTAEGVSGVTERSTSWAKLGAASIRRTATLTGSGSYAGVNPTQFAVTPGVQYRIRASLNVIYGGRGIGVYVRHPGSSEIVAIAEGTFGPSGLFDISGTWVAPAGSTVAVPLIFMRNADDNGTHAIEFYTDAIRVDRVTADPFPYFDGASSGWAWTGTAQESTSTQVSPVAPQTIRVFLSTSPSAPEWAIQTAAIRNETPSEIALIFASLSGFLLDSSHMDTDAMTI